MTHLADDRAGKFAPHDRDAPMFEPIDYVGLVAAVLITLGPLTAYALGF
jgi:hypothetical protein